MLKKGMMSASFIIGIIITLVGFVVIGGTIAGFLSEAEPKEAEIICQQSVALRAAAAISIGPLEGAKVSPILCKTIDKKISGTRTEVQTELANMITRCWWMWNSGRTEGIITSLEGLGSKNKGFVCYTALIEESKEKDGFKGGDKITEFDEFLRKTKYPKLAKVSYLDYVQYRSGGPGRVVMILEDGMIKPNHAYEIAYIEKKNGETNNWISTVMVGGGAATLATGAIVLAFATGGVSLVTVAAAGAVLSGGAEIAAGATIKYNQLITERDVGTIIVLDMSNKQILEEHHKNVFVGDLGGE